MNLHHTSSAIVKNKLKRENANLCHCNKNVPLLFSYVVFVLTVRSVSLLVCFYFFPMVLCGAASVGVLQDNLVLSTGLIM